MLKRFLFFALLGSCTISSLSAQISNGFNYRVDVRQAVGHADRFGIDYDLSYERIHNDVDPIGHHYGLGLTAKGFQVFDKDIKDVNSTLAELKIQGRYYTTSLRPLPAQAQERYLAFASRDSAAGGPGLTREEEKEYNSLFERLGKNRYFFTYDLHYRFESTQDLEAEQHAFGAGTGFEIPLFHFVLDFLPSLSRKPGSLFNSFKLQPVRAYIGGDYVTDAEETRLAVAGGNSKLWRLRAEAAWSTIVLDGLVLRAIWQAEYLIDAGTAVKELNQEFNSFVQAWLLYPLSEKTNVTIKYMDGYLPPNYDNVSAGKLGLSIALD
jgi:hypothetical protein